MNQTNTALLDVLTRRQEVLDQIAQKKVRANYLESLAAFVEENQDCTIEALTQKELLLALDEEIGKLPAKMKVIFEMRIRKHLSYQEIADELEISDKTVKKQVSNAIAILKPRLSKLSGWVAFVYLVSNW